MTSIEIKINNQKYVLRGQESQEHMEEVANLVIKKIENIQKQKSSLSLQKAAILAAFDFASLAIQGSKKSSEYKSRVLTKANELLEKVESALASEQQV